MSKSKNTQLSRRTQRPVWLIAAVVVGAVIVVVAIVAALTSGRRSSYVPEVTGAPRAAFDQTSVDHGNVQFEKLVESVFRVRNVGDQPLTILGEPRVELVQGC